MVPPSGVFACLGKQNESVINKQLWELVIEFFYLTAWLVLTV